jgi:hypothetical protein
MTERLTIRDRYWDCRRQLSVLASAASLYRAIGRRGRNGIHVYWSTLDPEEQAIYAKLLRADMHKRWHDARELAGLGRLLESDHGRS